MPIIDQSYCRQIQCGAITQAEAGVLDLYECAAAGFSGARGCTDPLCEPYLPRMAERGNGCGTAMADAPPLPVPPPIMLDADSSESAIEQASPAPKLPPITPWNLTPPMPSITAAVNFGPSTNPPAEDAACGFAQWVDGNPLLAMGLLAAFALMLKR